MEYEEIFNHRGRAYHDAMLSSPDARREEFEFPLQLLDLQADNEIYDFPSGGGYVRQFIPVGLESVKVHALEASAEFAECENDCDLASWSSLPIEDSSADGFLTLAALHHASARDVFYREVYRTLKVGGRFVLGDVERGSAQDDFLNGFVNEYNSMGHVGDFLDPETEEKRLISAGFHVTENRKHSYLWDFESESKMLHFCRGLFGLDLASDDQILEGLQPLRTAKTSIGWSLRFIKGIK